ncbi:MAG: hypothetical protein LAO31_16810 [Acidobacteriia bacterium]|nr:hypothetical protein [Terriglobia bacterium]
MGRVAESWQTTGSQTYKMYYGYNLAGGMTSEKHAEYGSRLQPTEIGLGTSGTDSSVLKLAYSYNTTGQNDNNGNVLTQMISVGATSMNQKYEYDALNRLKKIGENNDLWWYTYEYDQYGNRTGGQRSDSPFLPPLLIPGIDHIKNRINDPGYVHDNAGNLTYDPTSNAQYNYDAENRLVSAAGNSGSGAYSYDGDGRRVKKVAGGVTTIFVYDAAGKLTAEYSTGGPAGTGTSFLTADHLGSTRLVTDASGAVISRHDYLPFGETIPAGVGGRTAVMGYEQLDAINQKFTGKERDAESGLDYFGARYYGSNMGRWTSPDWSLLPVPIPYADLRNPQSLNLYSYINNNPILAADPDGHRDPTEEEKKRLQEAQQKLAIQVGDKQAAAAIADVNTTIAAVPDGASDPAGLGAAMSALNNLGSTEYAFDADLPDNGYTGSYGPRTDKCNVFVAEQYANGAGVGWDGVRGYPTNQTLLGSNYPPIANDLGDKNKGITGLAVVGGGQTTPSSARVGDVVGFHAQAAGREGHSAIFVGGNVVVYAGSSIVKANTVGGTVRGLAQQGHQIDQVTWRRLVPQ